MCEIMYEEFEKKYRWVGKKKDNMYRQVWWVGGACVIVIMRWRPYHSPRFFQFWENVMSSVIWMACLISEEPSCFLFLFCLLFQSNEVQLNRPLQRSVNHSHYILHCKYFCCNRYNFLLYLIPRYTPDVLITASSSIG